MRGAFLLTLTLLLAGCSDGSAGPDEVHATPETGIVRGVVLDTTITPIVDALVAVDGFNLTARSNADGAFGFDGLPEGAYFLKVSHPDFETVSQRVDVVAGRDDVQPMRLVLAAIQKDTPYVDAYQFDGFLQCSYRLVISGDNCGENRSEETYPLARQPDWVQSEMVWESTQTLGDELSFQYTVPGTVVDYIETEGPSPLTLVADGDAILRSGLGDGLDLYLRVFAADVQETEPPAGDLWGVGVQLDQGFTVYTHAFYYQTPPPGWTFLADGPV